MSFEIWYRGLPERPPFSNLLILFNLSLFLSEVFEIIIIFISWSNRMFETISICLSFRSGDTFTAIGTFEFNCTFSFFRNLNKSLEYAIFVPCFPIVFLYGIVSKSKTCVFSVLKSARWFVGTKGSWCSCLQLVIKNGNNKNKR